MKKNLRMLCMGLAAAATSMAFAQEPQDVTSKLWNHDFEKGPHGWNITAESTDASYNCWMPQVKGPEKAVGYYGYNNLALENWKGAGSGLKDNSVSQTVTDLPNGTYVFGAYMMATNDSWEPSIDVIDGVYIFANEAEIPVATHRVEGMDEKWAHSIKFNVATVVEDGTLTVGAKCVATNASFVTMDNTTLYYFGDMDATSALNEMAKIDIQRSLAIADTCTTLKASVDSLAYLAEAIELAKALTSADELTTADEELGWGMRLVRKSAKDYASLASAIAAAKEVAAKEWSEFVQADVEALNALIAEAEAGYEAATLTRVEIEAYTANLPEAAATVELDEIWTLHEIYTEKVDSIGDYEGEDIGQYSSDMLEEAENLLVMIDEELNMVGDIPASEAKANCEKFIASIQKIIDNPINYSEFPIWIYESDVLPTGQGPDDNVSQRAYPVIEGYEIVNIPAGTDYNGNSYGQRNNIVIYRSPLHRFREELKSVRFIIHKAGRPEQVDANGNANICVGEFAMFDEKDNRIPLVAYENVFSNCVEPKEGSLENLVDGNPGTFFHSLWSGGTPQEHYIEVDLPDGEYSAFRFVFVAYSNGHTRTFPRELEITYVSEKVTEMQQVMVAARELYPVFGTEPGFNDMDLTPFKTALAQADELVLQAKQNASSVSDDEVWELTQKIEEEATKIEEAGVKMPEEGKKYRIISSEKTFVDNQNVQKAMTIHEGDSLRPEWLWWQDACVDSAKQVFSFELIGEANDKVYYAIKHDATGRYLADYRDADGYKDYSNAAFVLSETPDSFELRSLGNGEFAIGREGYSGTYMHALNHNSGVADSTLSAQQGIGKGKGFSSSVITWVNSAYDYSGWFIREMSVLPDATKSFSDLAFQSKTFTLYSNVNSLTLKADKACAFENLVIVDNSGKEQVITSMEVAGEVATVVLEANIASFSFTFDNAEGVTEVEVDGSYEYRGEDPKLTELQTAYDNAVNKLVVKGTAVGQVADTDEFDTALANAAALLENGGETDALVAAKVAIDSAVAHLVYNQPVAGQEYFIQSALPWMTRWNSEMDIFVKEDDFAYWSYVNIKNMNHRWQFVDCGQLKNGMPAYYLYNVGTGFYLTTPRLEDNANGGRLYVVEDTTEAAPFNIFFLTDGKVAITDSREGNANGSWALHPMSHSNGTGYVAHGYMITWGKHDAASAMRVVEAEKVISDFMTGIEDVEIAEEFVAPAAKGIYDLFGRRIDTPAATGIYIVDGKKRVIKK